METILLVDDDAMVLNLCKRILLYGGYAVTAVGSAMEALPLIQNSAGKIDLALLDVIMPGMHGIELANSIRSTNPGIPVVLMTGYGPAEIARVARDNPYRIIWKPFRTESLLRMIENALRDSTSTTA